MPTQRNITMKHIMVIKPTHNLVSSQIAVDGVVPQTSQYIMKKPTFWTLERHHRGVEHNIWLVYWQRMDRHLAR